MTSTKVSLRKRELKSGKVTLYLDFYPPLPNPLGGARIRHEYLGIYLLKNPRTRIDKECNDDKIAQARAIRAQREVSIMRGQFDFLDVAKLKVDFLKYFKDKMKSKGQKWVRVYDHFSNYCKKHCQIEDITLQFCNGFRDYLLTTDMLKSKGKKLNQNSASGYWSIFRAVLALAYKEKLLKENLNESLEKIEARETRKEYLTIEELKKLAETHCDFPMMKAASLFACLTGLRISDVLNLDWSNIQDAQEGGKCMSICTKKTQTEATLPLSKEAYELCGVPSTGKVFKGLKRSVIDNHLADWIKEAGITKHITFHSFRHTFATLQVAMGTDIYTVSGLLTHKNVSTTQIYADIVDEKKREAVERIRIKEDKIC